MLRESNDHNAKNYKGELEERARKIIQAMPSKRDAFHPISVLILNIAMTFDHITSERKSFHEQLANLLDTECQMDTELLQMEDRLPRHAPYKYPERLKYQREILKIQAERRRLKLHYQEAMKILYDRLHDQLQKHDQISI